MHACLVRKARRCSGPQEPLVWLSGIAVITLGLWLGDLAGEHKVWTAPRDWLYGILTKIFPAAQRPIRSVLGPELRTMITGAEPAGRRPIKRDYLAKLICKIAAADPAPAVIGIDFLLRPFPSANLPDHPDYNKETLEFIQGVEDVAQTGCPTVLPRSFDYHPPRTYIPDPTIYDGHRFSSSKVYEGYINLPKDPRRVAFTKITGSDGRMVQSFAQAIIEADDQPMPLQLDDSELPFGRFANLDKFIHVSAGDVLRGDRETLHKLAHRVVLISGHWHQEGLNRGDIVDLHNSPLGKIPGVVLHANYVESILQSNLYWEWKKNSSHLVDLAAAALLALVFALGIPLVD